MFYSMAYKDRLVDLYWDKKRISTREFPFDEKAFLTKIGREIDKLLCN